MKCFSGARDDPQCDANTILLQLEEDNHMLVGEKIYTFTTDDDELLNISQTWEIIVVLLLLHMVNKTLFTT